MFKGFVSAYRLEINDMKQRKGNLIFYLFVPIILIWLYSLIASGQVNSSLDLTRFDVTAPSVLSVIIVFITMQLTVLRIVAERAPYGTLDRELIAISISGMYFGKLIANYLYAIIQVFCYSFL